MFTKKFVGGKDHYFKTCFQIGDYISLLETGTCAHLHAFRMVKGDVRQELYFSTSGENRERIAVPKDFEQFLLAVGHMFNLTFVPDKEYPHKTWRAE